MKVRRFDLDENEDLQTLTVEMTLDEAALFYAFVGQISPKRVADASGDPRWSAALLEAAECLGNAFNRWYDEGWAEVGPRSLCIATLKGETE